MQGNCENERPLEEPPVLKQETRTAFAVDTLGRRATFIIEKILPLFVLILTRVSVPCRCGLFYDGALDDLRRLHRPLAFTCDIRPDVLLGQEVQLFH